MINKSCKRRQTDEAAHNTSTTQQCFLRKQKKFHIMFPYYTNITFREIPLSFTEKYYPTDATSYTTNWNKMKCLPSDKAWSWAGFTGAVQSPAALPPHSKTPRPPTLTSPCFSGSPPPSLWHRGPSWTFSAAQRSPLQRVGAHTCSLFCPSLFIPDSPSSCVTYSLPQPCVTAELFKLNLLFKMCLFVDEMSLTRTISPSTPWTTSLS